MNKRYFGLTSGERELLNQPHLSVKDYRRLTRYSSTLAPVQQRLQTKIFSYSPRSIATKPPRYFARGALEKPVAPLTQFLTETDESSQPRPIPRNRNLLKNLCRGKGTLKQDRQGHLYLEIDNRFILSLLPFLKSQGLVRPPYFNIFGSPGGAHISVISARESAFHDLKSLSEVGEEHSFEIEGLYSLKPLTWPEVDQVWFFKIESPDLEAIRRKYFLPSLPGGHAFIISIAVKPTAHIETKAPMLRISPCVTAA